MRVIIAPSSSPSLSSLVQNANVMMVLYSSSIFLSGLRKSIVRSSVFKAFIQVACQKLSFIVPSSFFRSETFSTFRRAIRVLVFHVLVVVMEVETRLKFEKQFPLSLSFPPSFCHKEKPKAPNLETFFANVFGCCLDGLFPSLSPPSFVSEGS